MYMYIYIYIYVYIYIYNSHSKHLMLMIYNTIPFSSFGLLHPARPMSAQLENYMHLVNLRHMVHINCGATQESIESHTFHYKYKRVMYYIFV